METTCVLGAHLPLDPISHSVQSPSEEAFIDAEGGLPNSITLSATICTSMKRYSHPNNN